MNNNKILALCNQIEAAASNVYIRGCDGVARSNLAQLIGICDAVDKIRTELAEKESEGTKNA